MKPGPSETVLELLLAEEPSAAAADARRGVTVGKLIGFEASGLPLVVLPGESPREARPARTTIALSGTELGSEVVLAFEDGELSRPIVMGVLIESRLAEAPAGISVPLHGLEGEVDGESLVFTAKREIVLRCGRASITLTRAGKVLLRGTYLLSRSSGANRIKGGSVQIN